MNRGITILSQQLFRWFRDLVIFRLLLPFIYTKVVAFTLPSSIPASATMRFAKIREKRSVRRLPSTGCHKARCKFWKSFALRFAHMRASSQSCMRSLARIFPRVFYLAALRSFFSRIFELRVSLGGFQNRRFRSQHPFDIDDYLKVSVFVQLCKILSYNIL